VNEQSCSVCDVNTDSGCSGSNSQRSRFTQFLNYWPRPCQGLYRQKTTRRLKVQIQTVLITIILIET